MAGKHQKLITVNEAVLKELITNRLTTDHLFIVECLYNEEYDLLDIYDKNFAMERALMNYQLLERKDLIVVNPDDTTYYTISVIGREFYETLIALSNGITISVAKKNRESAFDEWWFKYPSSANWESDDGRKFVSGRSLRTGKKDDNKRTYMKILNEGKLTHEEMMACLKYEIDTRKKQSLATGQNNLQFMQGSLTYLNQRTFENFIDIIRSGKDVEDEKAGGFELG